VVRHLALRAASVLLCIVALTSLSVSTRPANAADSEMSFRLESLSGGKCGAKCPQVIVADGVIEERTPEAFVAFATAAASQAPLSGMILLNSPGGRVVASMRLGDVFRKLKLAVAVAGYERVGTRAGPTAGRCMSACVYAMMGAARRIVPPESQVGIHRMSTTGYGESQAHQGSAPIVSYADDAMVATLSRYTAQMGVNPAVIRTAETIAPENILILSPSRLRQWRLATAQF